MSTPESSIVTALTNTSRRSAMDGQSDPTLGAPFSSMPTNRLTVAQMGPGEPADNFPLGGEPRQWKYRVGWNFPTNPDTDRGISGELLRILADSFWLLRRMIEIRKAEMVGLEWEIVGKGRTGYERKQNSDKHDKLIRRVTEFFTYPEGYYSFTSMDDEKWGRSHPGGRLTPGEWKRLGLVDYSDWFNALLEDFFVGDWMSIWPQRTLGNEMLGFRRVDGMHIKPLLDLDGRTPPPPMPAWQQYLYGVPRASWAANEFYYMPRNVRNMTPYGFSHVQQGLIMINLGLKFDMWNTAAYTESTIPMGLLEAPPNYTANQIRDIADFLNGAVDNLAARQRVYPVPSGTKWQAIKPFDFNLEFAMYVIEGMGAIMDVMPIELGFAPSRSSSKGGSEHAFQSHQRKSFIPTARWFQRKFTRMINEQWSTYGGLDLEFRFKGVADEDQAAEYEANATAIKSGQLSIDTALERDGQKGLGIGHIIETTHGIVFLDKGFALTSAGVVPLGFGETKGMDVYSTDPSDNPNANPSRTGQDDGVDNDSDDGPKSLHKPPVPPTSRATRPTSTGDPKGLTDRPKSSRLVDKAATPDTHTEHRHREEEDAFLAEWLLFWKDKFRAAAKANPSTELKVLEVLKVGLGDRNRLSDILFSSLSDPVYRKSFEELSKREGIDRGPSFNPSSREIDKFQLRVQAIMVEIISTYHTDLEAHYHRLISQMSGSNLSEEAKAVAMLKALVEWVELHVEWKGREIAKTETTRAETTAIQDFAVQNPAVLHQFRWRAIMDEQTCDICAGLDGQVLEATGPHPPAHVGCRCWLEPAPAGTRSTDGTSIPLGEVRPA
ncbi:MAG: phage portal protein [Patescibacteria group bacterium]|nr:phage portal protein [Patescibacteria group bacterium]